MKDREDLRNDYSNTEYVLVRKKDTRRGPNKKVIDWKEVGRLLQIGCTAQEIASSIGVSRPLLYEYCEEETGKPYTQYAQEHKALGEKALRAKQHEIALNGDRRLLIWLGKNRLGQSDQAKVEHTIIREEDQIIQK